MLIIRKAKIEDYYEVNAIFREIQTLHVEKEPTIFKNIDFLDRCDYLDMIENKNILFIVSENNQHVDGYLIALIINQVSSTTHPKKELYIDTLSVLKKEHKKHIGTSLMQEAIQYAKVKKCTNISLNVWSFNEPAIAFYKHLNFKEQYIKMTLSIK